jgi:hypothetical protein
MHEILLSLFSRYDLKLESSPESAFERVLRKEIPSPYQRLKAYAELRALINHGIVEGVRPPHLQFRSTAQLPEVQIQTWTEQDIFCLVTSALHHDEPGIAKFLLTQWEIGQRMTSVRFFRYGHQYKDGCFFHKCRKTGREVRIEILNPTSRLILDRDYRPGAYMFISGKTNQPFDEGRISARFGYIRSQTPGYKESELRLRCIRHTTILQLALAGCTIPEIGGVTGHSLHWIYLTLEHYLPRDERLAAVAMAKRERMRIGNTEGELIIEGARRLYLGDVPASAKPLTPAEIALFGSQ